MAAVVLNFNGPINHPATTKLRNAICSVVNEQILDAQGRPTPARRYDSLFLLLNSTGGSLDDGLSLYNLIKTVPLSVTTVNMGLIASIAILPFLGGSTRIACPQSSFHFHAFEWNYPLAHNLTRHEFTDHTQILDAAVAHAKEILKSNSSLTDAHLKDLQLFDQPTIKHAAFAKEKGIVQRVELPAIPANSPFLNVDY